MASRNVYSPSYDDEGNPKPSIPELAHEIETAVNSAVANVEAAESDALQAISDSENSAVSTVDNLVLDAQDARSDAKGFRDDAESYRAGAERARDVAVGASNDAEQTAKDIGAIGAVDDTVQTTGDLPASNGDDSVVYVLDQSQYYQDTGAGSTQGGWEPIGPRISLSVTQVGNIASMPASADAKVFSPANFVDFETAVQNAHDYAKNNGGGVVEVPKDQLPYNGGAVTFDSSVEMVEELTSDYDVQVQAYGGSVADALAAKDPDVSEKYPGVVKAKWWISSGDGTPAAPYEDGTGTAGIKPAINYLQHEARGGKIILPRGLSRMTGTVTLDGYPFLVEGHGRPRSWNEFDEDDVPTKIVHEPSTADNDAIRVAGLTKSCKGTRFRDFGLESANTNSRDGIFLDGQDNTGRYGDTKTWNPNDIVFDNVMVSEFNYGVSGLGTIFHINHHNCWLTRNQHGLHYEGVKNRGGPISQIRCTGQGYCNGGGADYGLYISSNDIYVSGWGTTGNDVGMHFNTIHAVISKVHSEADKSASIVLDSAANKAHTLVEGSKISGADIGISVLSGDKVSVKKSIVGADTTAVDLTDSNQSLLVRDGSSDFKAPIQEKSGWSQVVYPTGLKYAEGTGTIPAGVTLRIEAAKQRVKGRGPLLSWTPADAETSDHKIAKDRVQFDDGNRLNVVWELTERTGQEPLDIDWTLWLTDFRNTVFSSFRVNTGTAVQTETSGQATLSSGSTSVTVSHGLDVTPDPEDIRVNALGDLGAASYYYITNVGASSFDINVDADPGQNVDFAWGAEV
jgi:hypothetical protein